MKQAAVWCRGRRAGTLTEDAMGYTFVYDACIRYAVYSVGNARR